MDPQLQQLIERINQAQNILVAVSANPSVDQLAATIGLTLVLNKLGKHGTAVFSGQVPSTIEFLKPAETIEKNTDSLRDFIIALDKSKADKLRYKVEDNVVRIFITPYKTSISDKDLEFSQGDFNVDVVVALGVTDPQDLDGAITAHGRILHDATVASISTEHQGSLGSINWVEPNASSLSEMVTALADGLDKKALDAQIATALLTGIVATTERFRNEKTSPKAMSISAELMAAGANQQLIATELEAAPDTVDDSNHDEADSEPALNKDDETNDPPADDTTELEIEHEGGAADADTDEPVADDSTDTDLQVNEDGGLTELGANTADESTNEPSDVPPVSDAVGFDANAVRRERITGQPNLAPPDITANVNPESLDPPTEELSLPAVQSPLLSHNEAVLDDPAAPQPAPAAWQPPVSPAEPYTSLAAPQPAPVPDAPQPAPALDPPDPVAPAADPAAVVDDARSAVEAALNGASATSAQPPIDALNAQPLGPELHAVTTPSVPAAPAPEPFSIPPQPAITNTGFSEPTPGNSPADQTLDMPLPANPFGPGQPAAPNPLLPPAGSAPQAPPSAFPGAQSNLGNAGPTPPPVPPPMLPPLQ